MESSNFNDPSSSYNSTGLLGTSRNNDYNILKDNYSLDEILHNRLVEARRLVRQLDAAINNENSIYQESYSLQFTAFVKQKKDLLMALSALVHDEEPNSYPKYRAEAYLKFEQNLKVEIDGLRSLLKRITEKEEQMKIENERMEQQCFEFKNVMNPTQQTDIKDAIKSKVVDTLIKEAKTDMINVLEILHPTKKDATLRVLSELETGMEEGEEKWVTINKNMDLEAIQLLLKINVIKCRHSNFREISLN